MNTILIKELLNEKEVWSEMVWLRKGLHTDQIQSETNILKLF